MFGHAHLIPDSNHLNCEILEDITDLRMEQLVSGAMFVSRDMHEKIELFIEGQYHASDLHYRILKYIMAVHIGIVPIINAELVMNGIYYWLPSSFIPANNSIPCVNDPYFSEYGYNWDGCDDSIKAYITKAVGNYPIGNYIGDSSVCGDGYISMLYRKPPKWIQHDVNQGCIYVLSSASCILGVTRSEKMRYVGSHEINGLLLDLCEIQTDLI